MSDMILVLWSGGRSSGGTGPLGGGLDTETKVLEDKARAGVAE